MVNPFAAATRSMSGRRSTNAMEAGTIFSRRLCVPPMADGLVL
ncbi:MAG: hypothetical protein RLZ98_2776 [Pseudomonadota bacterium]